MYNEMEKLSLFEEALHLYKLSRIQVINEFSKDMDKDELTLKKEISKLTQKYLNLIKLER